MSCILSNGKIILPMSVTSIQSFVFRDTKLGSYDQGISENSRELLYMWPAFQTRFVIHSHTLSLIFQSVCLPGTYLVASVSKRTFNFYPSISSELTTRDTDEA